MAFRACGFSARKIYHVVKYLPAPELCTLVSRSDLIKASLTWHEEEHHHQAFRHLRRHSATLGKESM